MRTLDIVFLWHTPGLSWGNWNGLVKRFPWAKRVEGQGGIKAGHIAAAKKARTKHFYVVDEDNVVYDHFDFSFVPPVGEEDMLHVWYARNPVNDLEYGYGGIKLFPRKAVLDSGDLGTTDYSMNVTAERKLHPEVASITAFNTDEFSAWRAGFREAAKLVTAGTDEALQRVEVWTMKGADRPFGGETIVGARMGVKFAKNSPGRLHLINDFKWLRQVYLESLLEHAG